jgi:predicted nucleotidyltransferase
MRIVGIVAEFNPFHHGHLYHLQSARRLTEADCVVIVMSGNYTQRGEPALVSKWARAEMALLAGADLVIELPVAYAMGSAEYFAFGAVRLLDSLGVVNAICFGSESGNIENLQAIAAILADEPAEYKELLKVQLSGGLSFPAARQKALSCYLRSKYGKDRITRLLKSSNDILGVEYLKALLRLDSKIQPVTINRVGSGYNSTELSGKFSSATSIRKVLSVNHWRCAKKLLESSMPTESLSVLEREIELGRGPVFPALFGSPMISLIRRMSADQLRSLPYMEAGLENRLKLAADKSGTYEELVNNVTTRRYTTTRIQRILFSLLIGLDSGTFGYFNSLGGPAYIRILGFNRTGRRLLSTIRGKTGLPVITKTADFKTSDIPGVSEMLALESNATNQYVLGFENPYFRTSGSDFTHNVINIDTSSKNE